MMPPLDHADAWLEEDELAAIARALVRGHSLWDGSLPGEPELDRLTRKLAQARVDQAMLELIKLDAIAVRWDADLGDWRLKALVEELPA